MKKYFLPSGQQISFSDRVPQEKIDEYISGKYKEYYGQVGEEPVKKEGLFSDLISDPYIEALHNSLSNTVLTGKVIEAARNATPEQLKDPKYLENLREYIKQQGIKSRSINPTDYSLKGGVDKLSSGEITSGLGEILGAGVEAASGSLGYMTPTLGASLIGSIAGTPTAGAAVGAGVLALQHAGEDIKSYIENPESTLEDFNVPKLAAAVAGQSALDLITLGATGLLGRTVKNLAPGSKVMNDSLLSGVGKAIEKLREAPAGLRFGGVMAGEGSTEAFQLALEKWFANEPIAPQDAEDMWEYAEEFYGGAFGGGAFEAIGTGLDYIDKNKKAKSHSLLIDKYIKDAKDKRRLESKKRLEEEKKNFLEEEKATSVSRYEEGREQWTLLNDRLKELGKYDLSVDDIHELAQERNIRWDADPGFMAFTRRLTGKEHLDELNDTELRKVWGTLYNIPAQEKLRSFNTFDEEQYWDIYSKLKDKSKDKPISIDMVRNVLGVDDPKYRDEYADAVSKAAIKGLYDRGMLDKNGNVYKLREDYKVMDKNALDMIEYSKRTGKVPSFNEWRVFSKLASRREYNRIISTLADNKVIGRKNKGDRFTLNKDLSEFTHGYKHDVVNVEGFGVYSGNKLIRMFRNKKKAGQWIGGIRNKLANKYDVVDGDGYVVKSFKNEGLAKSWIEKMRYKAAPFAIVGRKNKKGSYTYDVIDHTKTGAITKTFANRNDAIAYRDERNEFAKKFPSFQIKKAEPTLNADDFKSRAYQVRELKLGDKALPDRVRGIGLYKDEIDAAEALKTLTKKEPVTEKDKYRLFPTREEAISSTLKGDIKDNQQSAFNMIKHVIGKTVPSDPAFKSTFKSLYSRVKKFNLSVMDEEAKKEIKDWLEANKSTYDSIISDEKAEDLLLDKIKSIVKDEFKKLGLSTKGFALEFEDSDIRKNEGGTFTHSLAMIKINLANIDPKNLSSYERLLNTIGHEALHAIRQIGLLSEEEFNALVDIVNNNKDEFKWTDTLDSNYRKYYKDVHKIKDADLERFINEEKAAYALAKLFADHKLKATPAKPVIAKPFAKRVWDKIKKFVKAVMNSFVLPKTKTSKQIADQFVEKFASGEVLARRSVKNPSITGYGPNSLYNYQNLKSPAFKIEDYTDQTMLNKYIDRTKYERVRDAAEKYNNQLEQNFFHQRWLKTIGPKKIREKIDFSKRFIKDLEYGIMSNIYENNIEAEEKTRSEFVDAFDDLLNINREVLSREEIEDLNRFIESRKEKYDSIINKEKEAIDIINDEFKRIGLDKIGVELEARNMHNNVTKGLFYHYLNKIVINTNDVIRNPYSGITTIINALGHESIHMFRAAGLITNDEFNLLINEVNKNPENYGWTKEQENIYKQRYIEYINNEELYQSYINEEKAAFALGALYLEEFSNKEKGYEDWIKEFEIKQSNIPAHRRLINKIKKIFKSIIRLFVRPEAKNNRDMLNDITEYYDKEKDLINEFVRKFTSSEIPNRKYLKDRSFSPWSKDFIERGIKEGEDILPSLKSPSLSDDNVIDMNSKRNPRQSTQLPSGVREGKSYVHIRDLKDLRNIVKKGFVPENYPVNTSETGMLLLPPDMGVIVFNGINNDSTEVIMFDKSKFTNTNSRIGLDRIDSVDINNDFITTSLVDRLPDVVDKEFGLARNVDLRLTQDNMVDEIRKIVGRYPDIHTYDLTEDSHEQYNRKLFSKGYKNGKGFYKHNISKDISNLSNIESINRDLSKATSYQNVEELLSNLDDNDIAFKAGDGYRVVFHDREGFKNPIAIILDGNDSEWLVIGISADDKFGRLYDRITKPSPMEKMGRNASTYAVYHALKHMKGKDLESPSFFEPKSLTYNEAYDTPIEAEYAKRMSPITVLPPKTLYQKLVDYLTTNFVDSFRQSFLDRRQGILSNQEKKAKILRDRGEDIDLLMGHSAHAAALFADRASALTSNLLKEGAIIWHTEGRAGVGKIVDFELQGDIYKRSTGGLIHIFEPLFDDNGRSKNLYTKWHQYALALRGERIDTTSGRVIPMSHDEIAFGRGLADQYPEIKIVHDNYQRWNNYIVQFLIDTGMINEKMGNAWRRYADYIPFYKDISDSTPEQVIELMQKNMNNRFESLLYPLANAEPHKKYKGVSKDDMIMDPFEAITKNVHAAIASGLRNHAARLALEDGLLTGMARRAGSTSIVNENEIKSNYREDIGSPGAVKIRVNGESQWWVVADPLMFQSLHGFYEARNPLFDLLAIPANLLRETVTRTPTFIVRNILRDTASTWATSQVNASAPRMVVDSFTNAALNMLGRRTKEYDSLIRGAGVIGGYDLTLVERNNKVLTDLKKQSTGTPLSIMKKMWDRVGEISGKSESSTREVVYKRVLEETGSEIEALYQAMETINFARRGANPVYRAIAMSVPFLNARLQGLDVLARAFTGKYGSRLMTAEEKQMVFLQRVGAMVATTLIYSLLMEDLLDDPVYDNLRGDTRDNNYIIPSPDFMGEGSYLKIPIPFEVGVLTKLIPEQIYRYVSNDASGRDVLRSTRKALMNTLHLNLIPQAIKPMIEAQFNYDTFKGRPILDMYMAPGEDAYRPSTNELAKIAGEYTGISPMKIEHVIKGYTGSVGQYALFLTDAIARTLLDRPSNPNYPLSNIKAYANLPFTGSFIVNAMDGGKREKFYDLKNSIDALTTTIAKLEEGGEKEKVRDIREENKGMLSVKKKVDLIARRIQVINKQKRKIERSKMISSSEKANRLEKLDMNIDKMIANIDAIMEKANLPVYGTRH